jgi:hypothetical protein
MVSEVSVHGQLAPLQWACGEENIMETGVWDRGGRSLHGVWKAEKAPRGEDARYKIYPSKHGPETYVFQSDPAIHSFHHLPIDHPIVSPSMDSSID